MAKRNRSSSQLGKISIYDLAAEMHSRRGDLTDLQARRDELVNELDHLDSVMAMLGGDKTARRVGGGVKRTAKVVPPVAGRSAGGKRSGKRGQGWATVEAVLKASKGSGSSASLKDAWAKLGSKTPLSVALASFVKSGKLKRKGAGRETVYTLA